MLKRKYRNLIFVLLLLISTGCVLFWKYRKPYPSILLITIDALRPDHLGCYGYGRNTSPNIDKIAREGVFFTQAIAQAPWTVPSVVSILTSNYPYIHKVNDFGIFFPSDLDSLPSILHRYGYTTAFFCNMSVFDGIPDFDKQFDTYLSKMTYQWRGLPSKLIKVTEITNSINKWILKNKNNRFFLWIHFFDAHSPPLNPPNPYFKIFLSDKYSKFKKEVPISEDYKVGINGLPKYLVSSNNNITDINYYIAIYDGAIRYVDEQIGLILRHLERLNLCKNTLIIITSDHGEAIGEHNIYFDHGHFLYDEVIKTPLIIKYNKSVPIGNNVDKQVQGIDIAPTILDILKIEEPNTMKGISLLSQVDNKGNSTYSNNFALSYFFGLKNLYSIRTLKWKLIYDKNRDQYEFYDLQQDPCELNNIFDSLKDKNAFLSFKEELGNQIKEADNRKERIRQDLHEETKEGLRSLGYLQ